MKNHSALICLFFCLSACSLKNDSLEFKPVNFVNTQIGAIGHMLEPTAELVHIPHGMLRIYPLRSPGMVDAYTSSRFYGFPLNVPAHREGSIGRIMPYTLHDMIDINDLFSEYDHDFATSTPYYYGLFLEDFDIQAGITASERSGIMQFSYPAKSEPYILIQTPGDGYLELMENGAIQGFEMRFGMKHYFCILPDHTFTIEETSPQKGKNTSMKLKFSATPNPIHLRFGISFIDEKQARANLENEVENNDFEDVKRNAEKAWNIHLAGIEVEGADDDTKTAFYTALYRTSERMINISEDGRYFSAMGFYPFCPGSPYYLIGSPKFEKSSIHLGKGKKFTIEAKNVSRQNKYIQSARLNGRPLERAWFLHSEISKGGDLLFEMGSKPNKNWASDPKQRPPSFELP
jgi:putative alpha-1,2-mannosidase